MIEKCTLCHREHETGKFVMQGIPIKVCPEVPPNVEVLWLPSKNQNWADTPDYPHTNLEWDE